MQNALMRFQQKYMNQRHLKAGKGTKKRKDNSVMGENVHISLREKKEEGIKRMQNLCDAFNLGDKLVNYLKEDKLYYSYAYSMDTINYDERYAKLVRDFEEERNAYVYHVIEAKLQNGLTLLSLLFVSDYRTDWDTEQLEGNSIFTYTCCIEEDGYEDMGWIKVDAPMGYLMRIG